MEQYREIEYNGLKAVVSNYGNAKTKNYVNNGQVYVYCGKSKSIRLSRMIAKAFPEICGEWFDDCEVHHKDHNPLNNKAENLVVLTKEQHKELHRNSEITKAKIQKVRKEQMKKVAEYDEDWNLLAVYENVYDLERKKPISIGSLRQAISKSRTYLGHYWLLLD